MRLGLVLIALSVTLHKAYAVDSVPSLDTTFPDPPPLHGIGQDGSAAFDPLQGMDANGRIPKVVLPDDIPNPERWRYVPEGRIKPGSVVDRFMVSTFVAPIVYYEEAVGAGGGISFTDIDFRGQRRQEFADIYASRTTLGQEDYGVIWQRWLDHRDMPAGGVLTEERSWVRVVVSYDHTLTDRFYGLGPETRWGDETSYSDRSEVVGVLMHTSLPHAGDDWVVTLGSRLEHNRLGSGHVPDWPSTEQVYPGLVAAGDDQQSAWVTAALSYDTRDSQSNPYHGGQVEAGVDAQPWSREEGQPGVGSGEIWHVNASYVVAVPGLFHSGGDAHEENPPTDVLAIGGFVTWVDGTLPFWDLPSLGGADTLRGYIGGRFTDRAAWHLAAEYRLWTIARGLRITDSIRIERIGVAPFVEVGSVADSLSQLATTAKHESYGLSFRTELERTALFRFDVGFSAEGMAFNLAYGLSF
jgi:hypothetical protein